MNQSYNIKIGSLNEVVTTDNMDDIGAAVARLREQGAVGVPDVTKVAAPVEVGEEANAARQEIDEALLAANGFAPLRRLYHNRAGKVAGASGRAAATRLRQSFDKLPTVDEAVDSIVAKVRAEDRQDHLVSMSSVKLLDDGRVHTENGMVREQFATETGFSQLCKRADVPCGSGYIGELPPDRRAEQFAWWADKVPGRRLMQRTRLSEDGNRESFAFLSERYAKMDVDEVAECLRDAFGGGDARADFTYTGERLTFDTTFMKDFAPDVGLAEGEMFKLGCRARTSDVGTGGLYFEMFAKNTLCDNSTVHQVRRGQRISIAHLGNADAIRRKARQAIEQAKEGMAPFLASWEQACGDIVSAETVKVDEHHESIWEEPGFLRGLFRSLKKGSPIRETDLDSLVIAHSFGGREQSAQRLAPVTRASVSSAITRYAHAGQLDPEREHELEVLGGRVLAGTGPLAWTRPALTASERRARV